MMLGLIMPQPPRDQFDSPNNNGGYQPFNRVRWMIVRDLKPPTDATTGVTSPKIEDLADWTFTPPVASYSGMIGFDFHFQKVFKYDQNRFQILGQGAANLYANDASGKQHAIIQKRIRVMKPTYFEDTSATENAAPGRIYFFLFGNHWTQPTTDTERPKYNVQFRVSFTDT